MEEKKNYTKMDISKIVASRLDLSVNQAHSIISESFTVMREMMSEDRLNTRVEIRNFGTFAVKPARAKPRARNPRTNEEIYVPAHKKTHFRPGKLLKSILQKPIDD